MATNVVAKRSSSKQSNVTERIQCHILKQTVCDKRTVVCGWTITNWIGCMCVQRNFQRSSIKRCRHATKTKEW